MKEEPEPPKSDRSPETKKRDQPHEKLKKSYIERGLYSYLQSYFTQGYKKLVGKYFAPYFYYTLLITLGSIVLSILYELDLGITKEIVQIPIFLCLMSAVGLILGGLIGGLTKKPVIQHTIISIFLVGAVILTWFTTTWSSFEYNYIGMQWLKTGYFLIYLGISSFSMFFIMVSFQTSLSFKIVSFGNSPNRLFFQWLIRLGAWIGIPLYVYMGFQGSLDAQIIAVTGVLITISMLIKFYRLPRIIKGDSFSEKASKQAQMNLNHVLGFFNLYLVYHLTKSFNTGGQISNLTMDFIFLMINTLYMINNLSKKVQKIKDEDDLNKVFLFQRNTGFTVWLKKTFGEEGLILAMLGIALGYHGVYLDSYLESPLKIIELLSGADRVAPLNVTFHRTFLGLGLIIILGVSILFATSRKYQNIFVNRYSPRHVLKMFGDIFRVSEEGDAGVVYELIDTGRKKVIDTGRKVGNSVKKKWQNFFSLGGSKSDDKAKKT
jgi:hypothetical protein